MGDAPKPLSHKERAGFHRSLNELAASPESIYARYEATVQRDYELLREVTALLNDLPVEVHAPDCARGCGCPIGALLRRIDDVLGGEG